jgi:hypothetical protein
MADVEKLLANTSASEIKTLIMADLVPHDAALARVDAVLTRKVLTDGKRARWTRLREWIVANQTEVAENG